MAANPLLQKVHVYYLGGLGVESSPPGSIYVQSRGRSFQVPPVGESIFVERYYADDLISRAHNGVHSAFSFSAQDAERAKKFGTAQPQIRSVHDMSVEELEALLAERRREDAPVEESQEEPNDAPEEEPEVDETSTEEPETPDKPTRGRIGRPKKNESESKEAEE